ncbi:flagellar basal body rod protein FlgB [Melioribacter sp. Ez-97]|uniref:flagellar basal body rod protein FlgB n=1 Tax=Melioribacter sp. Ez-97 TaxID=3423434 RepID=UPI003ED921CA
MGNSIKLLENLLDYCVVKNKVIANNIANIHTENYKREDVEFKNLLEENSNSLLRTTESKHLRMINDPLERQNRFRVVIDDSSESLSGINNVNIEQEMAELAENTLRFKFASKKVGEYYKMIQKVINGGGRF